MACFAKRSGKEEIRRLADMLADVEVPERCDAALGMMALIAVQMLCASPGDAAGSMFQLARLMAGEE